MKDKQTSHKAKRVLRLAGMSASVASRYAGTKLRAAFSSQEKARAHREASYTAMAEDISETLGELKGAVMKLGQIASQTQDFLPKEFSQALKTLQKQAPPMPYEVIKAQVESELGAPIEALFKSFDPEPFAAASIGQVHRAVSKTGIELIVKVQYPGVDRSVDTDLKQLRLTLKLGGLLKLPKEAADKLFSEVRERLHEELDYEQEAKNLREFRAFHAKQPKIHIPKVLPRLSSKRVLTMEYLEGKHLDQLGDSFDQSLRNQIGRELFEMMAQQIFVLQKIHGDPHLGNFAFRDDGSVVVYDFGCVKTLKPETVDAYADTIIASIDENYDLVDDALLRLGARVAEHPSPGEDYYKVWRDIFFEPFSGIEEYCYHSAAVHIAAAKHTALFFKHMQHFSPPVDSLYIDRVVAGQYWIMKALKVKQDFRAALESYLKKRRDCLASPL